MKVVFELDNIGDVVEVVRALHGVYFPARPPLALGVDVGAQPAVAVTPEPAPAETPAPPKRRRKMAVEKTEPEPVAGTATVEPQTFADPPAPPVSLAPAKPSFLEDDDAPAKIYTKDDVRAALVALQIKRQGQYVSEGKAQDVAQREAEQAALNVLLLHGGANRLKEVDEAQYGAVIAAANAEAAK